MNIFLDETKNRAQLFPFTHTRHVADIRVGILTIRQKWELLTNLEVTTEEACKKKDSIVIQANIIPTKNTIAFIIKAAENKTPLLENEEIKILHFPWHIFQLNDHAIRNDFEIITSGRVSQIIANSNQCIQAENIFIEEGAKVEYCILNASTGPIYIGKNALLMEGSMIRGPFSAGEGSVIKMGSKIYGATGIGPYCMAGGEIKNSLLFGYSNKAHDGYLGDSVIGEWCNMGAGTSNSNIKNTGGEVKYLTDNNVVPVAAGNKAGLLMGDYSRCAINTSFNTGTVIGVCCNIFGEMPGKYVHHFAWGRERYIFEKALLDINNWKKMKGHELSKQEIKTLKKLYSTNL
jgi:UDP-N-acetylglucosamine diphosphorylase / glucose-1-phosphate thymidylyltransferase / UDP-N-acetylgalactosamine diphosphorylase / glucosamine-1-phosphate N-acetyltransferase / galactosamine-1-phosphate N-acetyltransferase